MSNPLEGCSVHVRRVDGRYPHCPGVLRSENIVASVTEIGPIMNLSLDASVTEAARVFRVRLDDPAHDDFWLDIVLAVNPAEVICVP